jgi:hypothetical protein
LRRYSYRLIEHQTLDAEAGASERLTSFAVPAPSILPCVLRTARLVGGYRPPGPEGAGGREPLRAPPRPPVERNALRTFRDRTRVLEDERTTSSKSDGLHGPRDPKIKISLQNAASYLAKGD